MVAGIAKNHGFLIRKCFLVCIRIEFNNDVGNAGLPCGTSDILSVDAVANNHNMIGQVGVDL